VWYCNGAFISHKEEEMICAMELKMKPVLLNLTNRVQLVEYIIYWQYCGKL
jgi:hypothetical protein